MALCKAAGPSSYFCATAALLLATAAVKAVSAFGNDKILIATEPILRLTYKNLFIALASAELVLAVVLVLSLPPIIKHAFILMFVAIGLSYHFSRLLLDVPEPCACLGNLFSWSPWLSKHTSQVAMAMLVTLACISSYYLLRLVRRDSLRDI